MEMTSQLAYEFRPKGHASLNQRAHVPSQDSLGHAFEKYAAIISGYGHQPPRRFQTAAAIAASGVKPSVDELMGIIMKYQGHPGMPYAGYFVTQVFSGMDENVLNFDIDLETPIRGLGYELRKPKILVNRSSAQMPLGDRASGTVINYGNVYGLTITYGLIINYGTWNFRPRGSGVMLNFGESLEASIGIGI